MIGIPSSVKPAAPADARLSISTSSFPSRFFVTVAVWTTCIPVFAPLSCIYLSVSRLSTAGFVFAIQTTIVNPPLAAAAAPVSISSLYVNPGSRKCTCVSTSPGATTSPSASMTSVPSVSRSYPVLTM